ncbi:PQQ-binding-like beta-propeller repeat protein [Saccharopolyspora sp. K220]|uniref:outer membrane protein assembly factor BamB family protein n=1 Tax=Saccharopolyspora soli TaxID=2926618 RepID=UPI001F5961ED|nr:PQQ-binding-like beta-propeller repeat protein [Saccharopolyspora soli]MCI2420255.1 PQQ-binding-like beta-propeller repeat protein [Saccharopolyspora soli]
MDSPNRLGARPVSPPVRRALTITMASLAGVVLINPLVPRVAAALDPALATISGVVYQDKNRDGKQDSGEPGVAGVNVSDGAKTVRTDDSGRYALSVDINRRATDIVFITKPAGFDVPTDEAMTPRFYQPLGQLVDGAQATADFALLPNPKVNSGNFTFANIADPHVTPDLADQLRQINSTEQDLAFVQVSGDLTNNATDAEFQRYRASTAASKLPVWPAVGNHEYRAGATYAERIDNYRRYVGPEWYSFDYGDRHFLVLENIGGAPLEEQREWAAQDLAANAPGKHVVVLMHMPMNVPFGSPSTYDSFSELLSKYRTELVLVGHEHSNDVDTEWVKGAKHIQTNSSSYTIDHSPRGFRYVHMWGDGFDNPFRMYGVDQALSVTSPAPGASVSADGLREVQVNAYRTSDEVTKVRYRIDGGQWRDMTKSGDFTWFDGYPTSASRAPGEHTLDVVATAGKDIEWQKSSKFQLTDSAPTAVRTGADWPQFHGDAQHSGTTGDLVRPNLDLAWTLRTPGSILTGSPAIVGGVAYVGTRDENGEGNSAVHAVEMTTGKLLWSTKTESSVHGSLAVSDGVVFAPTIHGTLHAFDTATGAERWRRDPEPSDPRQRSYSYYSPTVAEGKVFWPYQTRYGKASRGLLAALDPKTGATLWESPMTGATMSDGTPAVADGKVYVGNETADRIVAYDANTGSQLWQSSNALGGWQDAAPTAVGGRVFIGSNKKVIARDGTTGADLWSYTSPDASWLPGNATASAPAVVGDTMYMGFPDGRVTALNAATGAVVWSVRLPGKPYLGGVLSSPAVSGDTVYIGSNDGHLYGLDRLTGATVWNYEIGTWVASSPAISGNTMITGAWDGNLYAFTAKQ